MKRLHSRLRNAGFDQGVGQCDHAHDGGGLGWRLRVALGQLSSAVWPNLRGKSCYSLQQCGNACPHLFGDVVRRTLDDTGRSRRGVNHAELVYQHHPNGLGARAHEEHGHAGVACVDAE